MKRKTRDFLAGSAVAAACAATLGTLSRLVNKTLVGVALDKESPVKESEAARKKLTGDMNMEEALEAAARAGQVLADTPHSTVGLESHDGLQLIGHWFPCQNPKRTIVAMHGWRSSWGNDFGLIADFWHNSGCNVLYAEQRAQGSSGGEYMGFGMLERHDCLGWVKWVNNTVGDTLPVYLAGLSMGATTVLMTAALSLPENVRGIMADCGFTSAYEIWKHVAQNNMHISYGRLRNAVVNDLCRKKIGLEADHCDTLTAMQSCTVPVLFVHGSDDRFVPVEMTYENYKACNSPKRLLIVPGASHGMSYWIDKGGYEDAVREFWQSFDS